MKNAFRILGSVCVLAFAMLTTAGAQTANCYVICSGSTSISIPPQPSAGACCDKFESFCGSRGMAYWKDPSGYNLHCPSLPNIDP